MILGFQSWVTLDFSIGPRSEVLFRTLGSDSKESQLGSVCGVGDRHGK